MPAAPSRGKNQLAVFPNTCCKIFLPQRRTNVLRRDQPKRTELMTGILRPLEGFEHVLRYEPHTGKFFWLIDRPRKTKAGDEAGYINSTGYVKIRYNHRGYSAHRIAWYLHTKQDPAALQIDHINGNPSDNRIANLRLATPGQNAKNTRKKPGTASKYKGAHWYARRNKWQSQIRIDGHSIHLGYFDTDYEAHLAYCKAAAVLHGDFANFG
jgi:hypothetical protein